MSLTTRWPTTWRRQMLQCSTFDFTGIIRWAPLLRTILASFLKNSNKKKVCLHGRGGDARSKNHTPLATRQQTFWLWRNSHPSPTSLAGGTGKRLLLVGEHALMSRYPEHWISNRKLKYALKCAACIIQCTPVPDRRTDEHHDNSATIHSTNASRAKISNR